MALCALQASHVSATTLYAVVYGNQKYIVGSSTLHSGLFASRDTGRTWTQLGPRNLKAYRMDAVDSARGRILFIAAGDGVHKSTDYGATWRITSTWRTREVLDIKVDQRNPHRVYAATAFGFWRSTDGGENWEQPQGLLSERYLYRFDEVGPGNELLAAADNGAYRSTDGGATWVQLSLAGNTPARRGPLRGILRTGNSGRENVLVMQGPCITAVVRRNRLTFACRPATMLDDSFLYDIALDRGGTLHVAGGRGIHILERRTRSGNGRAWRVLPPPDAHAVHTIAFVGTILFAGSYGGGIYRYENNAWKLAGCEGSQIWSLRVKEW